MVGTSENLDSQSQTSVPKPQNTDPLGYTILGPKVCKVREPKRWGLILIWDGERVLERVEA